MCCLLRAHEGGVGRAGPLELLPRPTANPVPSTLSPPLPPRSELIQLVAVTQKTAERSYREHIEQQIQTYQRRCSLPSARPTPVPTTQAPFSVSGHWAQSEWGQ